MPVTEILQCSLQASANIGDEQNEAAKVLKATGQTLKTTEGVQKVYFGTHVENPEVFQLLVNWESVDHHRAFEKAESYTPMVTHFDTITAGAADMVHAELEPVDDFAKVIGAPVTEVATMYFGADGVPSDYLDGVQKFKDAIDAEKSDGFVGAVVGVTHEDNVKSPKDGHGGKAAVFMVGWESVEKHMAFRETATFKDNAPYLRNGVKEGEMHHVKFFEFVE